ncbi:MAG: asparaginase [Chloroflexi bacterium]|nr:asparaginase [Chloroflexota bacterium]
MSPTRRTAPSAPPVLVEVTRGDRVESAHRGSICVSAPDGSLLASVGDPEQFIFLRSSAKPFQLAPFVASGRFDEYQLTDEALAVMAASHSGEDRHVRLVQEILRRAGLTSSVLRNQVHAPFDRETANRLVRDGEAPTALRGNCSGKHAAMVLFAKASGWPIDTYLEPGHPVQRMALEAVSALTDVPVEEIITATDGCGAVTFGMPLRGLALAFARFADPAAIADPPLRGALTRIRDAMIAHPELVAGTRRRVDTAVMRASNGTVVAKGGAEGVGAMGILRHAPGRWSPAGIALTIEDGGAAPRAVNVATCAALEQAGVLDGAQVASLDEYAHPVIVDPDGAPSGNVRAAFRLA